MKKPILITIVFLVVLCSCVNDNEIEKTDNVRPSLEEMQVAFDLISIDEKQENAELVLIQDDKLWEEMNIQLVGYKAGWGYLDIYAVIKECEEIVLIKPGWGSYTFEYILTDLNKDGDVEMIGFFDWGSGIVRSILFVMNNSGEFEEVVLQDEENDFFSYYDLEYDSRKNTIFADAASYSDTEVSKMKLYYEDGMYCFEHE